MKKELILKNGYKLIEIRNFDNYYDFEIFFNNEVIGIFQLIEKENVFFRQIRIFEQFKRKCHASNVMDYIVDYYNRPSTFCISTISDSAVSFWEKYLSRKRKEVLVLNPKGNVYIISPNKKPL